MTLPTHGAGRIHWYEEDDQFYGHASDHDPRTTEHDFVVKRVPRDARRPEDDLIWAGWVIDLDRMSSQCVTHDHVTAAAAKQELEEVVS